MDTGARKPKRSEYEGGDTSVDGNRVIVTGENQFARLSEKDGEPHSTEVSFWRVILSPSGPGHALYLRSELTNDRWSIYADNVALARWLQRTVQGMLVEPLKDTVIPVVEAAFNRTGDPRAVWTETIVTGDARISLALSEFGDPILVHTKPTSEQPNPRRYGVCTVLVPALEARLTVNGVRARGQAWPRDRLGRPYSTSGLGLSESWTEAR